MDLPRAEITRQLGDPEVDQLDRIGRLRLDEDVLRLEIAVNDPLRVRRLQRLGHAARESRRGQPGERAPPRQHRGQRLPVEILHHDVGTAGGVDLAVEHLHDPRVRDRGGRARFQEKSLQQIGPADQLGRQQLHGRLALQVAVLGQVDLSHRARSELLEDRVAADGFADGGHELAYRGESPRALRSPANCGAGSSPGRHTM